MHVSLTIQAIMNVEAGNDIKRQLGPLTDKQWAQILGAFHYPILAIEPLSTFLFNWLTPRQFMGRIMLTWGIVCMCTAAVQNFGSLFTCRFLLGVAEAGFLPAILLHLTFFYPSELLTFRIAIVWSLAMISGMFSGLFAYAISHLDGRAGLPGWRWLFVIEGLPAVLCGIFTYIWLPNYPENTNILTKPEQEAVVANRPETQASPKDKAWDFQQVKRLLKDWSTYTFLLIFFCHPLAAGGVETVLPTVVFDLGMTGSTKTQLLTMPHSISAGIVTLIIALLIQKRKIRAWPTALVLEACTAICYVVLLFVKAPITKYVLLLFAQTFAAGVLPILLPERIRTTNGASHAGLAIALTIAMPTFHGIIGPMVWLRGFAPTYQTSYAVSIGLLGVTAVAMVATWLLIRKEIGSEGADVRSAVVEDEKQGSTTALCDESSTAVNPDSTEEHEGRPPRTASSSTLRLSVRSW